ncbi:MAG TPA: thioesterase, partial [Hyphomonas adhaerens]|nr:thioesterase [Hyphomonas adhaerens]
MTKTIEKSGEFAGWFTWTDDPYEHETAGPFYFKVDEQGPVAAFRVERKHLNANG